MIFTEKQLRKKYPLKLSEFLGFKSYDIFELFYYLILFIVCLALFFIITKKNNLHEINKATNDNIKNNDYVIEKIDIKNVLLNAQNKNIFIVKKEIIKEPPKVVKENINVKLGKYTLKGFLRFTPVQAILENKTTKSLIYIKKSDIIDDMEVTDINNDSIIFQYYDQTGVLK